MNTKCVFWFSLQLLCEIFPILRWTERDMFKNVHWCSFEVPIILVRFSWHSISLDKFFEKTTHIKFPANPSSGTRVVPCGRTDGHNEANGHFLQFCERASKSGMKCTDMQHSQWQWGTADWIHRVRFMSEARILILTTKNMTVLGQTQWVFHKGDSLSNWSSSSPCMPDHEFTDRHTHV